MELALHGIPGAADGSMSVRDFGLWQLYAAKNALPFRRLQLQLALVAMMIVKSVGGGEGMSIEDFLFDPPEEQVEPTEDDIDAIREAFGFNPRK